MSGFEELKKNVIDTRLCTLCGTCVGICPAHTLSVKGNEIVNHKNVCIDCGKCLAVCPGSSFDYAKYTKSDITDDSANYNSCIGRYINIYSGYSNDTRIRKRSSSGGCVTEMLLYLLDNRLIDSAVVTMSDRKKTYPVIVSNRRDIINAARSKYCMSSTNVVLQEILNSEKTFAYVGLSCQIEGLRKAFEETPGLRKRIPYVIGLFCGYNMTADATDYLIKRSHVNENEIRELSYRKKINGNTGFYVSDGRRSFFIRKNRYAFLNLFFSPERCLKCYDYSAEFADISFGDAWECGSEGYTRIITRTKEADILIRRMSEDGKIRVRESSLNDILVTQKSEIAHKKKDFWIRKKFFRTFPEFDITKPRLSLKEKIHGYVMTFMLFFAHSGAGRMFLKVIPLRLLSSCRMLKRR